MNTMLREAAEKIAQAIREIAEQEKWQHLTILVEDKGDILFEQQKALGGVGVLVIVTVDRYARRQNSGPLLTGTLTIDITASENMSVNRARKPYETAQGVAETLSRELHWKEFGGNFKSPLRFSTLDKTYPMPKITSVSLSFLAEYLFADPC